MNTNTKKEYKTAESISGPILVVTGVEGVSYEEMVEVRVDGESSVRRGKVLDVVDDRAVVQMFEATRGMQIEGTRVRFTGEVQKMGLSETMLGRVFSGGGDVLDGGPETIPERTASIGGAPINPWSREYPKDFIQTGISSIDVMNTLVRGQKLPIFSGSGLPHAKLSAQIARQAKVTTGGEFAIVFGAMGVTFEEARYFQSEFERTGAIERSALFLNTASDPVVERIATPRMCLTLAEYLAFEKDYHVLVILTDMTNYCEALREISSARKEVPGRRGYPGYMYTDLSTIYERAGRIKGRKGSITQLPILSMPDDDKTHPIPDLTGYITEGQFVLSRDLYTKGIYPPVDVQGSLSRLQKDVVDDTRDDHKEVNDQLSAAYAQGRDARELAVVLGESSLSDEDRAHMKFANEFENTYLNQSEDEDRSIEESLDMAWKLFKLLPQESLKRIKPKTYEKYTKS